MSQKFDILHGFYVQGKGIKLLSRELSISRNTVRSYLREYGEQRDEILNGGDKCEMLEKMTQKPTYKTAPKVKIVVTDEVLEIVKDCLAENERKIALGQRKLCMKGTDIHEMLVDKGFSISYPSVINCVRGLRETKKEAFIKQEYEFGDVCEFDWGEVKIHIADNLVAYRMAVFTLAKSGIRWAYLYRKEDTQAFIDAHIRFFAHIDCVPKTMVYDNMKVAVAKFVGKSEKEATLALKQISTYYGFAFRFCNVRRGNEKGHVERSVEFVRRKAFSSTSSFDLEESAHDRLIQTINRINKEKAELLDKEQAASLPKMPDYTSVIRTSGLVDKYSTVVFSQNHYSVPDHLVGKKLEVLAFVDEVIVKVGDRECARHKRSYERHVFILDILHYRETFLKKPSAIHGSLCLKQSEDVLRQVFDKFFSDRPREFVVMLNLLESHSIFQLVKAIESLVESGARVTNDNLGMILTNVHLPVESDLSSEIEQACEAHLAKLGRRKAS